MKRAVPLARTSTLRRTPMSRGRAQLTRKTPLKPRRRTKAERDAWTTLKQVVWIRDGGCCKRCGAPGSDVHHKRLKGQGGLDELRNLVLLCRRCHTHVHDIDRAGAERDGWIIPTEHHQTTTSEPRETTHD